MSSIEENNNDAWYCITALLTEYGIKLENSNLKWNLKRKYKI